MLIEQQLLDEYKKYDYLNKDREHPLVKILVSYIKPSFLFKSEILTPIQLGKAVEGADSKDGVQSEKNLKWLQQNCEFNDDFKGGISEYNRRIGFLTGTYWAWKNYEKLGNPKYFGSMGYRKLFDSKYFLELMKYDAIIPAIEINDHARTNMERYLYSRDKNMVDLTVKVMKKFHPDDMNLFDEYFKMKAGYYHEMYIMKKNIFFNFCDWIFPMMFELLKYCHEDFMPDKNEMNLVQQVQSTYDIRDVAFVMERLTGLYCYKLTEDKNLKTVKGTYHIFRNQEEEYKNKLKVIDILRKRNKELVKHGTTE